MLAAALAGEADALGRPERLPLHLREAPPAFDPRAAPAEEFLRSLLAPARCGMILTRADLARAARETNLSIRAGDRLFVLRTLLGQDAAAVLGWLAAEAARRASQHWQDADAFGETALWWEARARATCAILEDLRREAVDSQAGAQ